MVERLRVARKREKISEQEMVLGTNITTSLYRNKKYGRKSLRR